MIYFAQIQATGGIKIGFSDDVPTRLEQLERYYGCPMALLATMPGDRATETEIHGRFAHIRLGRKEQFRPARDLMEFIGKPLLVSSNPDAVETRPGSDHGLVTVKIESDIMCKARVIASNRGIPLASYLSGLLRKSIDKHWIDMIRRVDQETSG